MTDLVLPAAESDVTNLVSDLALKAPKASPTFTGTVTIPNAAGATDMLAYGQVPTPGSAGGPPKIVFRTSDATPITNTATLTADDTLLWAVGANDRWLFQGFLTWTAADSSGSATTADYKTGFTVPASATMQHGSLSQATSAFAGYGSVGTAGTPTTMRTAAQGPTSQGGFAGTWGEAIAGYYQGGGTAGTVTLTWSQTSANAATLSLGTNSILILWRLA